MIQTNLNSSRYDNALNCVIFSLIIAKNIIGGFVLFIPWTFSSVGYITGNLQLILTCILSTYTFCLIGYMIDNESEKSYSEMFDVFGAWMVSCVDLSIILLTIFANAGYLVYIKKRSNSLISQIWSYNFPMWALVIIVVVCFIFPLSFMKNLTDSRYFSLVSFLGIVFMGFATFVMVFIVDKSGAKINPFPVKPIPFFIAFPIYSASFDCHTNAPFFYKEYINQTNKKNFVRYVKIVSLALITVLLFQMIFANSSYIIVGNKVSSDVLDDFPTSQNSLITAMSIAVILSLIISFVLFFKALRESLNFFIFKTILKKEEEPTKWQDFATTTGVIVLMSVIGIIVNDMGYFNGVISAIFSSLCVFIFPVILAEKKGIFKNSKKWRVFNIIVGVFGVLVSFLLGTSTAIYDWVDSYN